MIAYKEFLPVSELRDRIECYWKFTVGADLATPLLHVFPPEGCCNLLFVSTTERRFILFAGPSTIVREITVQPGTVFFGIRIKPGCSEWLNPADPLSCKDQSIFISPAEITQWQQNLLNSISFEFEDISIPDNALIIMKQQIAFAVDLHVAKSIQLIIDNAGSMTAKEVASQVCISPRQLERKFLKATGITMKQFSQLRRLRKAIVDLCVIQRSKTEMIIDRGYADPAHFYKSFRNISGYPMSKFQQHLKLIENQLI
jgi:AraC-like DNA-binding protein